MTWICFRRHLFALGACLLLALANACSKLPQASFTPAQALPGPSERESWLAYVAAGKRFGFLHTRVARLENGLFRYIVEERLLISVLGVSDEEITSRREYVITHAYRPVSFQSVGVRAGRYAMESSK
jgi:hypothetical protein